jgi:uncharacterized protein YodC (DUF2158 family)
MEQNLKVGDCVQLLHGYTPKMSITKIDESQQMAECVWFNPKPPKHMVEWLPLNGLKLFPQPAKVTMEELKGVLYRR